VVLFVALMTCLLDLFQYKTGLIAYSANSGLILGHGCHGFYNFLK